jgi:NhaP-type Na+/H+ or K+/H+ antiporter
LEIARVTVAIQVLNSGLKVRKAFDRKHAWSLSMFLTAIMVLMWLASAAFVLACFPHLGVLKAALIGAMLAPTDPVLASSIVRGHESDPRVPDDIKELIVVESAANDGLALPLVYLPLLLLKPDLSTGAAIGMWFYDVWAFQVLLGALIGAVWGAVAAWILNFAIARGLPDKESRLAFEVALALSVLGGVQAMGSDGILACFTAGVAFYWVQNFGSDPALESEASTADAVDILLTFAFFVYLGYILPWSSWGALGVGQLFGLSIAVLLLTRLPFTLLLRFLRGAPVLRNLWDAAFVGWFGPVGVAAIYYAVDAEDQLPGQVNEAFDICSFIVLTHVIVFSVSAPPLTRLYARHEIRLVAAAQAAAGGVGDAGESAVAPAAAALADASAGGARRSASGRHRGASSLVESPAVAHSSGVELPPLRHSPAPAGPSADEPACKLPVAFPPLAPTTVTTADSREWTATPVASPASPSTASAPAPVAVASPPHGPAAADAGAAAPATTGATQLGS